MKENFDKLVDDLRRHGYKQASKNAIVAANIARDCGETIGAVANDLAELAVSKMPDGAAREQLKQTAKVLIGQQIVSALAHAEGW